MDIDMSDNFRDGFCKPLVRGSNPLPGTTQNLEIQHPRGFSPQRGSRRSRQEPRQAHAQELAQSVPESFAATRPPRLNEARARYVYVITRPDGRCKIGVSRNAKRRLYSLQGAQPEKLTLFHHERPTGCSAFHVEQGALLLLDRWRVSGEWVRCEPGLAVMAIEAAQTGDRNLQQFFDLYWTYEQAVVASFEATKDQRGLRGEQRERAALVAREAQSARLAARSELDTKFRALWARVSPFCAWMVSRTAPAEEQAA